MKADGGHAFPIPGLIGDGQVWKPRSGMSLRDWFAGQALRQGYPIRQCYHAADELLAERDKEATDAAIA